jgi:TolB-like protein/AraC-like DNA-binding protein/TPR repeat protein
MPQDFLKKAREIILDNLINPQFGVPELAREIGTSRSVLLRRLKTLTGKSASSFIREIRLQRAMELIEQEGLSASEASYQTGFSSPAYFSHCFHEHFGYPPGEIKKKGNNQAVRNQQSTTDETFAAEMDRAKPKAILTNHRKHKEKIVLTVSSCILLILAGLLLVPVLFHSNKDIRIAVMPFRNMGNDTTQQWFCEGFKEDLLNNLSRISSFSVVSRISSDQYRNTKKSLKTIGKELNVDYLIEGSVGREDGNLKIWVQLIDSKKDKHIWVSDTIRKTEEKLLEVQSDLAQRIAGELKAVLTTEESKKIEKAPTKSIEAYNLYQQGNYFITDFKDTKLAIRYYEKAIELDPRFALAYAQLAYCWAAEYFFFWDHRDEVLPRCKQLIDKAFEIDPVLAEARLALGYYHYWGFGNYADALKQTQLVLKEQPKNVGALSLSGYVNRRSGHYELAKTYLVKALELNPRSYQLAWNIGGTYDVLRDYAKAYYYYEMARLMEPDAAPAYLSLVTLMLNWEGNTVKSRKIIENARINVKDISTDQGFLILLYNLNLMDGNYEEALRNLSSIKTNVIDGQYSYRPIYTYYAKNYGLMKRSALETAYYDSSRVFLEKRILDYPEDPRLYSALGLAYAGLHLEKKAIASCKMAIQLLPATKEALTWTYYSWELAIIYTMLGKYDEAIELIKNALSIPGFISTKFLELEPRYSPMWDLPAFKKMIKEFEVK